jgi:heme exporter protein D
MPDLGDYAVEVLSAYAVTLVLLVALIAISVLRARKIRASLAKIDAQRQGAQP